MLLNRWKQVAGLMMVSLSLSACGGGGEEFELAAKKQKLNKSERIAFEACDKTMKGKKPILKFGTEEKMMSNVPLDVCACQSRAMAIVFEEGTYKSYSGFTKYLTRLEKKGLPRLGRKDLKKGMESERAAKKLLASFESCTSQYLAEYKGQEQLQGFLQPPPPPKPKKGEKQASAE